MTTLREGKHSTQQKKSFSHSTQQNKSFSPSNCFSRVTQHELYSVTQAGEDFYSNQQRSVDTYSGDNSNLPRTMETSACRSNLPAICNSVIVAKNSCSEEEDIEHCTIPTAAHDSNSFAGKSYWAQWMDSFTQRHQVCFKLVLPVHLLLSF